MMYYFRGSCHKVWEPVF